MGIQWVGGNSIFDISSNLSHSLQITRARTKRDGMERDRFPLKGSVRYSLQS